MNQRAGPPQTGRLIVGSSVSCKSSIFANTNCFNQSACRERRPQRRPAKRRNATLAFGEENTQRAGRPARLKTDNIQQHVELWPLIHQRAEIYGSNQSRCLAAGNWAWMTSAGPRARTPGWAPEDVVARRERHFFFFSSVGGPSALFRLCGWMMYSPAVGLNFTSDPEQSPAVNKRISAASPRSRPLGTEGVQQSWSGTCGGSNLTCWNAA